MSEPVPSEVETVRRAADGEGAAFELLHRAYRVRVRHLVRGYVSADDAEDVVQVAFMRAHASLRGFRGDAAFSTWLTRIAVNAALSHLSGERARQLREDPGSCLPEAWMGTCSCPPDKAVELSERTALVRRAISQLPTPYGRPMWMRYVEDCTYEEIARELHVTQGTLKTWLHRGRRAVGRRLACLNARPGGWLVDRDAHHS